MGDIYQVKASDSHREFEAGVQDLIVAHCEEIYKLKGEMRKRDLSMDELQSKILNS
jgi:hypothetical protein